MHLPEIMKRSCLKNKFLYTRSDLDWKAYNKQINYVVTLLRKEKTFYSTLNTNILTENRTFWKKVKPSLTDKTNKTSRITLIEEKTRAFWKTAKPFLTNKTNKTSRITLIKEERVISQDYLIAKTFNKYIINIPIKNMPKIDKCESIDSSEGNSVTSIIKKYQNHPSINLIESKSNCKTFRFRETNTGEIK